MDIVRLDARALQYTNVGSSSEEQGNPGMRTQFIKELQPLWCIVCASLQQADASSSSERTADSGALGRTHKHIRCVRIPAADQREQADARARSLLYHGPIVDFHGIGRNCLSEYVIAHRKDIAALGCAHNS